MQTTSGVEAVRAYRLDGKGRGEQISWEDLANVKSHGKPLWVHLNFSDKRAQAWLEQESGIDQGAVDALLMDEIRPRCERFGEGLMATLRGVNLNPGAQPDDMISLRIWADPRRMISLSRRPLKTINDLATELEAGTGPTSSADLVTNLTYHLVDRMVPVLDQLSEFVDDLEQRSGEDAPKSLQAFLASLRHQIITMRRHLAPQREAMSRLVQFTAAVFDESHRVQMQHAADQIARYVEELDELRERTIVIHDLISGRLADTMNRQMLLLSLIAAIFLPLGLLTGLLGINVGGIPGASDDWAFAAVCILLVVLAGAQLYVFKRLKWF